MEGNYPCPQIINVQVSFSGERDKNEGAIFRNQPLNYKHKAQFLSSHNMRTDKRPEVEEEQKESPEHTSGRCLPLPRLGSLEPPGQGLLHVRRILSMFGEQITQSFEA